jgi:hypothetical protein
VATETEIKEHKGSFAGGLLLIGIAVVGFAKREKIKVFLKNIFA